MSKRMILIFSLMTCVSAQAVGGAPAHTVIKAKSGSGFQCWPSVRETNWVVRQNLSTERLQVTVENNGGYESMPQFEGPGTAGDLLFWKMQAQDLKFLGDRFVMTWSQKDCEVFDPEQRLITCKRPGDLSLPGAQILTISSFKVREVGFDGEQVLFKYRFTLVREGNTYFVTLVYPERACRVL